MKYDETVFFIFITIVCFLSSCSYASPKLPINTPDDVIIENEHFEENTVFRRKVIYICGRGEPDVLAAWVNSVGLRPLSETRAPALTKIAHFDEERSWWNPSYGNDNEFSGMLEQGRVWIQVRIEGSVFFMWAVGYW